ncbi:MAG: radical SAM protein [Candidatus Omnitrophota bacterium]
MKILFVGIPHHYLYSKISKSFGKTPPVNLAGLAAFLLDKGFEVQIFDPAVDNILLEDLHKYLPKDFDAIAVSSLTPTFLQTIDILKIAKAINPKCISIMGGPHFSALPLETMAGYKVIDFGIIGEGEITLFELLETLQNNKDISKVKGLVYRDNGHMKFNPVRERITNLDKLPFPAYHLLPMNKYGIKLHHFWSYEEIELSPYTNLFTSRGCRYNCTFCGIRSVWGNCIYFKSAEYILSEIDLLVKKHNIKCIEISDSCLLANKPRLFKILDGLIERDYNLNLTCMLRVDSVDEPILKKLKKAKFRLLRFGVESGSQQILNAMNKQFTLAQIKEAFRLTHKIGIAATACVIIGYPGETKQTFKETLRFLNVIKPTAADFYIALPLVGTEFYRLSLEKGYIPHHQNWSNWTFLPENPVLNTPDLSSQDLKFLIKKAYIKFYLNPSFIIKSIKNNYFLKLMNFYWNGTKLLISMFRKQNLK